MLNKIIRLIGIFYFILRIFRYNYSMKNINKEIKMAKTKYNKHSKLVKLTSLPKQIAEGIPLLGETVWVESSIDPEVLMEGLVIKEARQLLVSLDHSNKDENIVVTRNQLWIREAIVYEEGY